ncbi:CMD domain-containing protein [Advenella mandrilli]|nr:CMD domain protein [Advenella mandrilli]
MSNSDSTDLIDDLLGLDPQGSTHAARHFRTKVLKGTQASYEALFSPAVGLSLTYRWLVALYASRLSGANELAEHYLEQAREHNVPEVLIEAVESGQLDGVNDSVLEAILVFTRKLVQKPVEGDKAALLALKQAGVATPDIVALAQLIAFLSYQIRLVAGLKAMQALEKTA